CLSRLFVYRHVTTRALPSFPTRRSSDLTSSCQDLLICIRLLEYSPISMLFVAPQNVVRLRNGLISTRFGNPVRIGAFSRHFNVRDRKSTRLNSSHVKISYAVFCLKKKKK